MSYFYVEEELFFGFGRDIINFGYRQCGRSERLVGNGSKQVTKFLDIFDEVGSVSFFLGLS